jgi:subtilisin-like proprotein convertase family protein
MLVRSAMALLAAVLAGSGATPPAAVAASSASFGNTTVISVPASGAATPYPSSITVTGLTGQLVRVTVTLVDLSHGHVPDLDILLVGPGGQTVLLLSDCCHSAPISRVTPMFDDFGRRLTAGTAVASGATKPVNLDVDTDTFPPPAPPGPYGGRLSVFNGTDPNGTWRLFVHDDQPEHEGSIAGGWSLTLHTQTVANEPPAIRSASLDVSLERDAGSSRAWLAATPPRGPSPGPLDAWRTVAPTRTISAGRTSRRGADGPLSPGT